MTCSRCGTLLPTACPSCGKVDALDIGPLLERGPKRITHRGARALCTSCGAQFHHRCRMTSYGNMGDTGWGEAKSVRGRRRMT